MDVKRKGSRTYTVHIKYHLRIPNSPGETVVVNTNQTHRQARALLASMHEIWKNTSAVIEQTHSFLSISTDLIVIRIWFELER